MLTAGDDKAFTEIYERYWKPLLQTACRILEDKETARDIIQEVFISLWKNRESNNIANLKAYLQQAVRFSVFKAIRNLKHDKAFYDRLADITVDIISTDPLLFKEQKRLLHQLLESLPADCREVFRLSREELHTYKQIGETLGISEKTVEKKISKALRLIRSGLSSSLCVALIFTLK